MASLVVTAHYNTSVSEEISVFAAWSTGNDDAYCEGYFETHFGCQSSVSANIFLTQFTVLLCFFNILINHYIVCE